MHTINAIHYFSTIPASPLSMVEFRSTSSEYLQPSILSIVKSAPNRFFPTRPTYVIYATGKSKVKCNSLFFRISTTEGKI